MEKNNWTLTVEERAFDVLLDSITWNFRLHVQRFDGADAGSSFCGSVRKYAAFLLDLLLVFDTGIGRILQLFKLDLPCRRSCRCDMSCETKSGS